jgi:hypothetical protein
LNKLKNFGLNFSNTKIQIKIDKEIKYPRLENRKALAIATPIPTLNLFFQQKKKNKSINTPEKLGSGTVNKEYL